MFATLLGTNIETDEHKNLCTVLCQMAIGRGFVPPDTRHRIQPDQIPLDGWQIEQRGPADSEADFLLAVTAPKVPSISPIPVKKTAAGPLFSVVVMKGYFGVWRDNVSEYSEFKETAQVMEAFDGFLKTLIDLRPDELSFYTDSLFLGRVACSNCGSEFSLGPRPAQDDATWAASMARKAIEHGWCLSTEGSWKALCPVCQRSILTSH